MNDSVNKSSLSAQLFPLLVPLVMVFSGFVLAQDTNSASQTNELVQSEGMDSNDDSGMADDLTATNQVSESNSVDQASATGPDGRTRRLQRQKHPRSRNAASQQNGAALSGSTNNLGPLDYSAFRLVSERNIFDPNRQPHTPGARPQPKTQDSLTLVGTMSYDKGDFAFFDGTSADYKKVLKPADTIVGYKVVSIRPDSVKLQHESTDLELPVGSQLRHQGDGTWVKVAGAGAYAASPVSSNSSPTDTTTGGADSDILKRLMQRREKENSP